MDRILILLDSDKHRTLFEEWLQDRYEILMPEIEGALENTFDLCILDGPVLDRLGTRIEVFKRAKHPVFVPFLMVAPEENDNLPAGWLGHSVDEQIAAPFRKVELQARVELLLRTGRLSVEVQRLQETRLASARNHLKLAVDAANVGLWDWDLTTNRVCYSPVWKRQLGYEAHEITEDFSEWRDRVHPDDLDRVLVSLHTFIAESRPGYQQEFRFLHRDGSYRWVLAQASLQFDLAGNPVRMLGCQVDITERKESEERIRKLNRVYAVLSNINQAIVRHREPQKLFEEACRIAVEEGGFRMAQLALMDEHAGHVFAVAHAGIAEDRLKQLLVPTPDSPSGCSPTATALREGRHIIVSDVEGDPCRHPSHGEALKLGCRSVAAFPLLVSGKVRGALSLYAGEANYFDDEEVKLLDELATDLGFALEFATQEAERMQTAQLLRESESRYRSLFEHNPTVMLLIEPSSGAVVDANPAASGYYGWKREELKGKNIGEINTLSPEEVREEMNRARLEQRRHFVFQHRLADGAVRDVEVTSGPISVEGKLLLYTIVHDITERKKMEKALRESEERLRLALQAANQGLYDLNVQTGEATVTPEYATMLGYDPREFSETNARWIERLHPDDRETVAATYRAYVAGEVDRYQVEFRQRTRDGQWKWILSLGKIVERDNEGQPLRMLGTHTDITERKRAEEEKGKLQAQLLQAQKMEAVGRLAGGVAHDFNNMLGVIIGHTELLLSRITPEAAIRRDLQEIRKAAERSADLTRQLLAFARKQTAIPKILDLNDTVAGMLKMLRRLIGEDLDLAWMPGHDLWNVKIDPSQVDQILANLTVNARDAIIGVGKITIETANLVVDEHYGTGDAGFVPGEYVLLAVSDTGAGMDKEILEHIFEPFFSTKEVGKGTGLGLATVYGIVKQNRGFVNVYSEPGRGTTFRIYIPRHQGKTIQASPIPAADELRGGTETVLIVEDEEAILNLGKAILERLGYRVLAANTPGQALRLAGEYAGDIHLLITDVVMPEMNGRELADRLARIKPEVKCLYMSGYTANVIAHHGVLDEGVFFIQKPFSLNQIAEKTREALGD